MTKKERVALRMLQDRFIARVKRINPEFPETAQVFSDNGVGNPPITLASLQRYIYPAFAHLIRDYLND